MAHGAGHVPGRDIVEIAIDGIDRRVGEGAGHVRKDLGAGEEIVGMQEPHDLSGAARDPAVDGVVDAGIELAEGHDRRSLRLGPGDETRRSPPDTSGGPGMVRRSVR